jgi:hypothetical protein
MGGGRRRDAGRVGLRVGKGAGSGGGSSEGARARGAREARAINAPMRRRVFQFTLGCCTRNLRVMQLHKTRGRADWQLLSDSRVVRCRWRCA